MCICEGPVEWESCEVHYLTGTKKTAGRFGPCSGVLTPDWSSQEERFDAISDYFVSKLRPSDGVLIENYAMGAKGKVFHIGENTGLLKHKLYKLGVDFKVASPSALKKFATGKGNSNKEAMNHAFVEKTGYDVRAAMGLSGDSWNPSSDVVDSYFLCQMLEKEGAKLTR
jgi:hypothetical protein